MAPGRPEPRDRRAAGVVQSAFVDYTGAARPSAPDVRIGVDPDRALRGGRVRVAHLFSGPRREGDVQQALELEAGRRGLGLGALSVDILYGDVCDLTDPVRIAQWRSWCRDGTVSAVIGGPPRESWSRARAREGGPELLRGVHDLWGLPLLHGEAASKVEAANSLLMAMLLLIVDLLAAGGVAVMEHPATFWHELLPSVWRLAAVRALLATEECQLVSLDQCQVGSVARAPTFLLAMRCPTLMERIAAIPDGGRCSHGPGAHAPPIGRGGMAVGSRQRSTPTLAASALSSRPPSSTAWRPRGGPRRRERTRPPARRRSRPSSCRWPPHWERAAGPGRRKRLSGETWTPPHSAAGAPGTTRRSPSAPPPWRAPPPATGSSSAPWLSPSLVWFKGRGREAIVVSFTRPGAGFARL